MSVTSSVYLLLYFNFVVSIRLSHHNLVLDALHCLENWVGLSSRVGEEGDLGVSLLALHERCVAVHIICFWWKNYC